MSESANPDYAQIFLRILKNTYERYPWKAEGMNIPIDIAMDPSGFLPVWWNQVEQTAKLLDIAENQLPATLVEDRQAATGKRLEWREDLRLSSAEHYLFRAILPAIAMDAVHVLHQQENVLLRPRHLEMFPESRSLTNNLTAGLPVRLLMDPIIDTPEQLPFEAENARPETSAQTPEDLASTIH